MGMPGAKPKPGKRYPSGQLVRPTTQAAQNEANEIAARKTKAVVLAQPHRRRPKDIPARDWDPEDPRLESVLGRFCIAHQLKLEIFKGAIEYGEVLKRWRAAKGIPMPAKTAWMPVADDPVRGDVPTDDIPAPRVGDGPAPRTVDAWTRFLTSLNADLRGIHICLPSIMADFVLTGELYAEAMSPMIRDGLVLIAVAFGVHDNRVAPFAARSESDLSPMRMRSLAGM